MLASRLASCCADAAVAITCPFVERSMAHYAVAAEPLVGCDAGHCASGGRPWARHFAGRIASYGVAVASPFDKPILGRCRGKCRANTRGTTRAISQDVLQADSWTTCESSCASLHVQRRDTCEPTSPYFCKESGVPSFIRLFLTRPSHSLALVWAQNF